MMMIQEGEKLFRELINKIYNEPNLTVNLLEEIEKDMTKIDGIIEQKTYYREIMVLLESAKKEKSQILRNNYKYLLLSNLEQRYRKIKETNIVA